MVRRDFGNVRRLESGRFQARYVDRNGRTRTASFDTKRLAVEHLAEAQADDVGSGRAPSQGSLRGDVPLN